MKPENNAKFVAFFIISALAMLAYYQNIAKPGSRCNGFASCLSGKVDRIVDGDTLVIRNVTVRLALVNAPERFEELGKEAENFTAKTCPVGSVALVDEDDDQTSGSYGRMVAVVYCNGKNLNELLLENGFGTIHASFCRTSEFRNEEWAKGRGC